MRFFAVGAEGANFRPTGDVRLPLHIYRRPFFPARGPCEGQLEKSACKKNWWSTGFRSGFHKKKDLKTHTHTYTAEGCCGFIAQDPNSSIVTDLTDETCYSKTTKGLKSNQRGEW